MTIDGLARVLAILGEEYGMTFSDGRRAVWYAALMDVDDETAVRGVTAYLTGARSNFKPHPGDILAIAREDLDRESEMAIVHLEANVSDHQVVDLGPALNAVVRAMGGPDHVVNMIVGDQWRFQRSAARRLFEAFRRRGVSETEGAPAWPLTVSESEANRPKWREIQRQAIEAPKVAARVFVLGSGRPALPGPREEVSTDGGC